MDTTALYAKADRHYFRKRLVTFGLPALILAYFVYVFFAFDIPGLASRAKSENAATLVADSYSYKTEVLRDNRSGAFKVAIEGERKGTYETFIPNWVEIDGENARVDLEDGYEIVFDGPTVRFQIPDYGVIEATPSRRGIEREFPAGDLPDWINASKNRIAITTPNGRLTITKARTQVYRYFFGWELFWFTLDSPYYDKGPFEILFGDQIDPDRTNVAGAAADFWNNAMWRHKEVAWAIFETILMAFLGTIGGAIVALPLSFIAAKNFTPAVAARFGVRRLFDFVRGVDALIWTIILSRAFGPGPLTGSIAILITDAGTFGKIFSEALENVDDKQIEGVHSTGAKPLQRYRFGVIPQITPILLSQVLYFLESNTRSATVVGAIVGGGIGLMLTQAIITQKDWEEVSYYIVLIVLMVMLMDTLSGWLRRRLIKGDESGT